MKLHQRTEFCTSTVIKQCYIHEKFKDAAKPNNKCSIIACLFNRKQNVCSFVLNNLQFCIVGSIFQQTLLPDSTFTSRFHL